MAPWGDIACIVSEDLVLYQSFDREKVAQWLEKEELQAVLARDWGFSIRSVEPALTFDFSGLVGPRKWLYLVTWLSKSRII